MKQIKAFFVVCNLKVVSTEDALKGGKYGHIDFFGWEPDDFSGLQIGLI